MNHLIGVDALSRFLLAVALVVLVCHLTGALFGRLRQPPIIGEIVGGLLLGPSVLGACWPEAREWIFPAEVLKPLDLAAQLGLVTFMFLLGCELQMKQLRTGRRTVASVVAGAMGLPFVLGVGVAVLGRDLMAGNAPQQYAFPVFFGLAVSVTALPVLARVLVDLGLDRSPIGVLALACAAVGDGLMWGALTVMLGLLTLAGAGHALLTAGLAVALVGITVFAVRPALKAAVGRAERRGEGRLLLPGLITGAIAFAAVTQSIGLHPVIGAFLFGAVVPRESAAVARISHQLQGFTVTVLLPLFFAGVGLRTSIGLLGGSVAAWSLFAAVLAVAVGAKFAGTGAGARLAGLPKRDALRLGALMNCRGVTELVVASIGWQYGLISELGLTVLVLVALITTMSTTPLMTLLTRVDITVNPTTKGRFDDKPIRT
jgi:Kef-type K+ transport system membrane component KefB